MVLLNGTDGHGISNLTRLAKWKGFSNQSQLNGLLGLSVRRS
jgi:hypothetical protein